MEFKAKKWHVLEMEFDAKNVMYWKWEKSAMRPSWTYKLRENIISMTKGEKYLGVIIQDNLTLEKHIDRIFGDIFRIIWSIWMAFNFLDKDTMKKKL